MFGMFVRRTVSRTAPALAAALLCLYAAPVATAAGASDQHRATAAAQAVRSAQPAKSSDSYRYWSFWQQKKGKKDRWAFATQGPGSLRPHDGDVIGFRFALSSDSQDAAKPRGAADFDAICGDTKKKAGRERVAVNVDFGTRAHAPHGETPPKRRTGCARVPEDASASDALSTVAKPLRYDSHAVLCSIHGYPQQGCPGQESGKGGDSKDKDGAAGADAKDEGGGLPTGVGVGVGAAVVLALAAAATWQVRRRR